MMQVKLTQHQLFYLLCLFFFGGISYIGGANEAGRDSWLSFLIAGVLIIPLLFCFLGLVKGEQDVEAVFCRAAGKWGGRFLCLLYGVLAIYVSAVAISIFVYFISETALIRTPRVVLALLMALTIAFLLRCKLPALGRFGEMTFPIVAAFVLISILATLPQCNFRDRLPVARHIGELLNGTWTSLLLHYGECFFPILALCTGIRDHKERKRGALGAVAFAAVTLCSVFIKNLCSLDLYAVTSYYFPSFAVASSISLGPFFQRFEIFVAINFAFCELCKAGLCLLFAQKALAPLLHFQEKALAGPLALTSANLALLLFGSEMELYTWLGLYKYFLTPFLVLLPLALLLSRWMRDRHRRRTAGRKAAGT